MIVVHCVSVSFAEHLNKTLALSLHLVSLSWGKRRGGKCEREVKRGVGEWMEGADGWRTKEVKRQGLEQRERPFIDLPPDLPTHTHTHTHHISFIFVSSSHGNLFGVEMLCLCVCVCVCVCLTLSHSIRREETLMTCICGNTSDSNINTHQLEISPEP